MNFFLIISIFLIFIVAQEGFQTHGYQTCKNDYGIVSDVKVKLKGCELRRQSGIPHCGFKQKLRPVIQIHFKPNNSTGMIYSKIQVNFNRKTILEIPQVLCALNFTCPIEATQNVVQEVDIGNFKGTYTVSYELTDVERKKKTICNDFLTEIR